MSLPMLEDITFPQFNRFPLEIKWMIWLQAFDDSNGKSEELCIINRPKPPRGGFPAINPNQPCVDLAFPPMMHACAEARAVVLSAFSGAQFRYSLKAHCNVRCRELDPELDTVYLSHSNFNAAMLQINYFQGLEQRVQKVAIDACIIIGLDHQKITRQVMPRFPRLREVRVVLKSESLGVRAQTSFRPPTKRFKLVEATPSGLNTKTRELHRWILHLYQKAQPRVLAMPGTIHIPPANMVTAMPNIAIGPPTNGLQVTAMPNIAIAPPTNGLQFRLYVFSVPVCGAHGLTDWQRYPRVNLANS